MTDEPEDTSNFTELDYLRLLYRDIHVIRGFMSRVVNYMIDAEREIPERMRRFIMYMHDVHDVMNMYQEQGQEAPEHVKAEARRCDDRFRQLLTELHTGGGAFEKVRREMATDPKNRWDHTMQLPSPTHIKGQG